MNYTHSEQLHVACVARPGYVKTRKSGLVHHHIFEAELIANTFSSPPQSLGMRLLMNTLQIGNIICLKSCWQLPPNTAGSIRHNTTYVGILCGALPSYLYVGNIIDCWQRSMLRTKLQVWEEQSTFSIGNVICSKSCWLLPPNTALGITPLICGHVMWGTTILPTCRHYHRLLTEPHVIWRTLEMFHHRIFVRIISWRPVAECMTILKQKGFV